ncbi:iron reductase [Prauserella marina]|uniref:Ferric reductase like transmembrane component n=1 Tax=Prauserella marina TaxID=530584 RepID=A0A222VPH8_9PSEU|nr:ferric reductase-like transmembrane domain-containing protein [Prauserella marina]ASR35631.1 iron reductase [Prauserella marina]PWV84503.1 ferric reductase like protein [Prauserella marina]SDC20795.1 Ferric reductase like transmembrane component [Prauserella marina]
MVSTEHIPDTRRRPGLRADLRGAIPDATAALVVTLVIFGWLYWRVEQGTSATIAVMPHLADAATYWMYWLCQAFGWSALLWAWLTTMLGLIRSSARPNQLTLSPARVESLHRTTSLTTIGLMFAHAFLFFLELVRDNEDELGWLGRIGGAFVDTFVPGGYSSGTGRVAILLGLLAFYLAIPLGLAYYFRQRTGARAWRALHRFVIVCYVLSVWHTLLYGTNVWFEGWPRTTLWLLQVPVALLLIARLLAPARPLERLRALRGALGTTRRVAALLIVVASVAGILAVVVTGRDGGRTPGAEGAPLSVQPWMVWTGTGVLAVAVLTALLVVSRARR